MNATSPLGGSFYLPDPPVRHDISCNKMSASPGQMVSSETQSTWRNVVATTVRLLTFRASSEDLVNVTAKHLVFGVICTLLVGIGRFWDNPRVRFLLHIGVGSVVYVFALSLLLWLIVWPLRPQHWSYFRVAVFVSLVSPPAIIYAIPVEKFYSIDTANSINVWFLAIVAVWRVALLFFFLRRLARLEWFSTIVVTLLPLTLIVVGLTMLNLEKVVFNFMGGMSERTGNDAAYGVLFLLSVLSMLLFLPILSCYVVLIIVRQTAARKERLRKIYEQ